MHSFPLAAQINDFPNSQIASDLTFKMFFYSNSFFFLPKREGKIFNQLAIQLVWSSNHLAIIPETNQLSF